MRIKHFAGYGCVNAVKVKDNTCRLHIRVTGNHEWGIERGTWDDYGIFNWLVKRFDKKISYDEFRKIAKIKTSGGYTRENGLDVEYCDYYFDY